VSGNLDLVPIMERIGGYAISPHNAQRVAFDLVKSLFSLCIGCLERKDNMWILPLQVHDLTLQFAHRVHIEIRRETVMPGCHDWQERDANSGDPA
jgi:hypothetical protein